MNQGIQLSVNRPPIDAPTSVFLAFRTQSTQPHKYVLISNGNHSAFEVRYEDGELKIVINGQIVLRAQNLAVADAEPHLLSVVFHRGGRMILYLDGLRIAQTICPFPTFTNTFTLGSKSTAQITSDLFLILAEEVTAVKQAAFYNNGYLLEPNLVFHNITYSFDTRKRSSRENLKVDKFKNTFVY